jgi:hypothetical protein
LVYHNGLLANGYLDSSSVSFHDGTFTVIPCLEWYCTLALRRVDPETASNQYRIIFGAIDAVAAGVFRNQSYSYGQFTDLFNEKIHALVQCREAVAESELLIKGGRII